MRQRQFSMLAMTVVLLAVVIFIAVSTKFTLGSYERDLSARYGLDLRGGMRVLLEVPADQTVTSQSLADAKAILEKRANGLGVSEVTFQISGNRRIIGEFPGLTDTQQVITALKQTGVLAFVPLGQENLQEGTKIEVDASHIDLQSWATSTAAPSATLPPTATQAPTLAPTPTGTLEATPTLASTPTLAPTKAPTVTPTAAPVVYRALLTGAQLSQAAVSKDTLGKYQIEFTLKSDAAELFKQFTGQHTNEFLAIVLDGVIISNPTISNQISDGKGVITGSFTYDTANNLAIQLRYGSLPVPLNIVDTRSVSASLGEDSIRKSVVAGFIGLAMVAILMIVFYRLPGFLATLALILYALTTFALFKVIPVTLTLPGIAGFVLSVGVAVDANILIFERLKEELHAGRPLNVAIDLAWRRAWLSIRDSNISTLITCLILMWFGSTFGASIVVGFAFTLLLGVLVSLFTAVVVTRNLLHVVLDSIKLLEHPTWFGV